MAWLLAAGFIGYGSLPWFLTINAPAPCAISVNEKGTAKPDPAVMKRLIQLGLPIALALFFEVTLFAVVALLVSPLGIVDVAGHQIALNLVH